MQQFRVGPRTSPACLHTPETGEAAKAGAWPFRRACFVEYAGHLARRARQGLRPGMLLACKEAKIFPDAYHTRLFFINGLPAS